MTAQGTALGIFKSACINLKHAEDISEKYGQGRGFKKPLKVQV